MCFSQVYKIEIRSLIIKIKAAQISWGSEGRVWHITIITRGLWNGLLKALVFWRAWLVVQCFLFYEETKGWVSSGLSDLPFATLPVRVEVEMVLTTPCMLLYGATPNSHHLYYHSHHSWGYWKCKKSSGGKKKKEICSIVLDVKVLACYTDSRYPHIFRGCFVLWFISQHLSLFELFWVQLTLKVTVGIRHVYFICYFCCNDTFNFILFIRER